MEVVFGFVVFLVGMFSGGFLVIGTFAKAGMNKQNMDWLVQIEKAKRGKDVTDEDVALLVNRIASAPDVADKRYHA